MMAKVATEKIRSIFLESEHASVHLPAARQPL